MRVRVEAQGKVHAAGEQRFDHLVLMQRAHLDIDARITSQMLFQHQRQEFMADGRKGRQPHLPALTLAQVDRDTLELVQLAVDQGGLFEQHTRLGCRCQRAPGPDEQFVAQLQFGMPDGFADRRGRDADQPRGRTHVAGLHDGLEDFELPEVHGGRAWVSGKDGCEF